MKPHWRLTVRHCTMYKIIISKSHDPYYNIAVEHLLTKQCKKDERILFLWQNQRTVVCGRNQNPLKECDVNCLMAEGGHVVRRYSGGGAVYHDLGNLNFTFVSAFREAQMAHNTEAIIQVLRDLGIQSEFSGRNDILVAGRKVSGAAYYEVDGILCHHGTLLVDSNLDDLERYLQPSILKLKSKGIDSIKSRVINLQSVNVSLTPQIIIEAFIKRLSGEEPVVWAEDYFVDQSELLKVEREKLMGWEWIQGESPAYEVNLTERFPWGEVSVLCAVENGSIQAITVYSDALDLEICQILSDCLKDCQFNQRGIQAGLSTIDLPWKQDCLNWLLSVVS